MTHEKIPEPVVRRLPRLYRLIRQLRGRRVPSASSAEIARQMGTSASQVRQDFHLFGKFGHKKGAYSVPVLEEALHTILGLNQKHHAIIIGAGNIGNALLHGFPFAACSVSLDAAFDVSAKLVDTVIEGVPVLHFRELSAYLEHHQANIVILTVPCQMVQPVLELVRQFPVKGIWNFTNMDLDLKGSDIVAENVHFADSLAHLSYRMSACEWEEDTPEESRSEASPKRAAVPRRSTFRNTEAMLGDSAI